MANKEANEKDIVQRFAGVLGRWQIWICFAVFMCKFPVAWHQLSVVFISHRDSFTCIDNATDKCAPECPEHVFDRSMFTETIITQWDLVCGLSHWNNFAQLLTMLGILVGNLLFGFLSDRWGRRNPLVGAVILQVVSGTLCAVVPWFWAFLILKFLCAVATGGTMVTSFVLIMELVGTKWRTAVGIIYQIPFNLGHFTLAVFAYFLRDWRYLQLALSLPSALLISYFWIVPESPRWLLVTGRERRATEVLTRAAKCNKLPTEKIASAVQEHIAASGVNDRKKKSGGNIMHLFKTRSMCLKSIAICFNWIVCGLCFFGVSQYIGELGGNKFVNVGFSALIQVPGTLISILTMEKLGRRWTLIGANAIAGISTLLIAVVPAEPAWIKAMLGCFGMFGLSICFPTVYIYSGELYPTMIRNIGVGTSSMSARLGSMVAPYVATLVDFEHWLPPVIFGVTPLVGLTLCYFFLPETLGVKLPDTMEEADQLTVKTCPIRSAATPQQNGNTDGVVQVQLPTPVTNK